MGGGRGRHRSLPSLILSYQPVAIPAIAKEVSPHITSSGSTDHGLHGFQRQRTLKWCSMDLRGLPRRPNPENESFFILDVLLLSQNDAVIAQHFQGQHLCKVQAAIHHLVLNAQCPPGIPRSNTCLLPQAVPGPKLSSLQQGKQLERQQQQNFLS